MTFTTQEEKDEAIVVAKTAVADATPETLETANAQLAEVEAAEIVE